MVRIGFWFSEVQYCDRKYISIPNEVDINCNLLNLMQ